MSVSDTRQCHGDPGVCVCVCVIERDGLSTKTVCVRGVESMYVIVRLSVCVCMREKERVSAI